MSPIKHRRIKVSDVVGQAGINKRAHREVRWTQVLEVINSIAIVVIVLYLLSHR